MSTRRVFHILDETEPFSECAGGAISRWVANVVRRDEASTLICQASDGSWTVPKQKVRVAAGYSQFAYLRKLPVEVRTFVGSRILQASLADLASSDVVWVHNRPEFCAGLASFVRSRRARLVLHLHNSVLDWKRDRILRSLQVDRTVFVSEYLRNAVTAKFHALNPSAVIYNGSDEDLFHPGPVARNGSNGPLSIVFAGRLVPEKGAHLLCGAVAQLNERNIPVHVKIIGSTGFGKNTASRYIEAIQAGASDNIEFLGYRPSSEVAQHLRDSDVFCLPAVWDDPFPLAPLEAMASGVAVVASRSGGIPEAFRWGGGCLVEKNNIHQLASALARLAQEPDTRRKISEAGLASFRQHFTWPKVIAQFRAVVDTL